MTPEILTHAVTAINAISAVLDALIEIIPKLVTLCAILSAAIAPDKMASIRKVVDFCALNFGHAKNANAND